MTALVIKNLPDAVMLGLKARAKANHRSVTKVGDSFDDALALAR